jgi:hypothetical protein
MQVPGLTTADGQLSPQRNTLKCCNTTGQYDESCNQKLMNLYIYIVILNGSYVYYRLLLITISNVYIFQSFLTGNVIAHCAFNEKGYHRQITN